MDLQQAAATQLCIRAAKAVTRLFTLTVSTTTLTKKTTKKTIF